ncbi:hypothetical protein GCM10009672_26330 [Nesterenkonia lutea]
MFERERRVVVGEAGVGMDIEPVCPLVDETGPANTPRAVLHYRRNNASEHIEWFLTTASFAGDLFQDVEHPTGTCPRRLSGSLVGAGRHVGSFLRHVR